MRKCFTLTLVVAVAMLICLAPQAVGKATNMTNKVTLAATDGKLMSTVATPHCHMQKTATAANHVCNHNNAVDGKMLLAKLKCKLKQTARLSNGPFPAPTNCDDCAGYCDCEGCWGGRSKE